MPAVAAEPLSLAPAPKRRRPLTVLVAIASALTGFLLLGPSVRNLIAIPAQKQLAVLPFESVGTDQEAQFFAEGVAETLASKLTQVQQFHGGLTVVPMSEVRSLSVRSAAEARKAFGVNLAITGSVQRGNGRVHVNVNLVDARHLRQLKSISIDTGFADLLQLQDGVAKGCAGMLDIALKPEARQVLAAGGASVPTAYDLYIQGRGYLQRFDRPENVDKAIELFERALSQDPGFTLAEAARAAAYWRKYLVTREPQWVEKARAAGLLAAGRGANLAQVQVTLGIIDAGTGRYDEAVREFGSALSLEPVNAEAYLGLGSAYEAQGQIQKAEEVYRNAIRLRPGDWLAYNRLATYYFRLGRYEAAEAPCRRIIELTPDNHLGYRTLGGVYLAMGRYEDATRVLEKALSIRETASALTNLGTVYYYQRRFADAARMMEKAVSLGPSSNVYILWGNLGDAYRHVNERDKATAAYDRAIELADRQMRVNPKDANALSSLAIYQAHRKRGEAARANAEEAVRLAPRNVNVLYKAVVVFELTGDRNQALRSLESALAGGYSLNEVEREPDLEPLRTDARYQRLSRLHQEKGSRKDGH